MLKTVISIKCDESFALFVTEFGYEIYIFKENCYDQLFEKLLNINKHFKKIGFKK